jgi:hypothetical protein
MRGDLTIRKVRTASGANAVQVVRYVGRKCVVVQHIGNAHDEKALQLLIADGRAFIEAQCVQGNLFSSVEPPNALVDLSKVQLQRVTHTYARKALLSCAKLCGLEFFPLLYRDLAVMRIIEPASKLHTI